MPTEFKLKDSARLALALSAAFPLTYSLSVQAAPAGRVDFAAGSVSAVASDGQSRPLAKGSDFNPGETIHTAEGQAQLRFSDGSQVSLRPGTQYRIDEYRFAGKNDGEEKGFFSLLKGGFRTITGLIGKADKRAYKVTTSVATIGIRGTEFLVLDENGVKVSTGEGAVEVCTSAGCIVLASGETAVVRDQNNVPVRVITKGGEATSSAPGGVTAKLEYSKTDEGLVNLIPTLPSGPGYAAVFAGMYDGGEFVDSYTDPLPNGVATFSTSTGEMLQFDASGGEGVQYKATVPAGGMTDGVIGWGRWTASTYYNSFGSPDAEFNVHYIVGKPTPAGDMTALYNGNMVGTYTMIGYTYPTASSGAVGGPGSVTATLTADFSAHDVGGNLGVRVGSTTFADTWSGSISGSGFGGSNSCSGACLDVSGMFIGPSAQRAGFVYKITGVPDGNITGAVTFKQTGLTPTGMGPPL